MSPDTHIFDPDGRPNRWLEVTTAAVGFAAITTVGVGLHLALPVTAFLYFLIIVLVALRCGFVEASAFSLVAAGCLDFFFTPPFFSFRIDDPSNWMALGAFEFAALVVSRLSAQAEHHARSAERERHNIEKLYELARLTLLIDSHSPAAAQIAVFVRRAIQVESVALYDSSKDRVHSAGPPAADVEEAVRATWADQQGRDGGIMGVWSRVLRLGPKGTGAIALRAQHLNPLVADAVASIAAAALERSRSLEKETRAEAARQSEQLRAAVLDALAHAFKTPLTVIRAASSGLLEAGTLSPQEAELVTLIDDESERLNGLATRLMQTARLEGKDTRVRRSPCDLAEIAVQVLGQFEGQLNGRLVRTALPDPCPPVPADAELIRTALWQLVDNAIKYSWPGTEITLSATIGPTEAVLAVHNLGPVVPREDRERIFDRFFRSAGTERLAPGTGLGLSVTRRVAEAHQGRAWVVSDEKAGTTFYMALPLREEDPK